METVLLFLLLVLTIWLAYRGSRDRATLELLRSEGYQVEHRIARLEQQMVEAGTVRAPAPETPSEPPPLPVATLVVPPVTIRPGRLTAAPLADEPLFAAATTAETRQAPGESCLPAPVSSPGVPVPEFNWEQFVGVRLFAWLGGLALFFAAALGLKYSFEHDLIPPVVRAAGGFLLGLGLIAGGVAPKRKAYLVLSQTLCATGVLILYAVTFACRAFYHFPAFGPGLTFTLMVLITAGAFRLAVWLDGQVIAVLGLLGGFLTPVILSTGVDNPWGLFGYVALLDIGLLAVAGRKRWDYLALLAAMGTAAMQAGWFVRFFDAEKIFIAHGVFLVFPVLFLAAFLRAYRRDAMNRWLIEATALLSFVALAFSFKLVLAGGLAAQPGRSFTIAFGADLVLLAMVGRMPRLRALESAGGGVLFLLLVCWTLGPLTGALLYWAFGLYLAFAILHTVFPLLLQRCRPTEVPSAGWWSQFIPAASLLLVLLPVVREMTVPWMFWLVVLVVDVLAVLLALAAGAFLGLLAVLVFTVGITAVWLTQSATQAVDLSESLVVIGGFGLFLFGASAWVMQRVLPADVARGLGLATSTRGDGSVAGPDVRVLFPALSAGLPFLLLNMVVAQFRPENPSLVFGLAAVLLVMLLGLAKWTRVDSLLAVALGSVGLLQFIWLGTSFNPRHAAGPLAWLLGFYAMLTAFPFLFVRTYRFRSLPWAVSALAGPVHFFLALGLMRGAYPGFSQGWLPAGFAVPALVGVLALRRLVPDTAPSRLAQLAWYGGVTLFFVTLIFPLQFSKQWLTLAWGLEGAALCWLFGRVPHPGLRAVGIALLATAFVRLALNPAVFAYHSRSAVPILNWYLATYGLVTLALFAAAYFLAPPRHAVAGIAVPPILQGLGTVLAFLLVNIEIADYFSTGSTLTFEFSGNFARDMTYTIAWAVFALGLLLVGMGRRLLLVRYASLSLLGVALLKLFLHDLAHLNQLYRIGAFAAVAVIAILASFLYQRFLAADENPAVPAAGPEEP